MNKQILDYYLQFSMFTYPGLYKDLIAKLPDDIRKTGLLLRKSIIHRTTLAFGNTGSNSDLKYGDMKKVPKYRQAEDDYFPTAVAIIAELYRRDKRGFILDRKTEDKLILTCRFIAILMASILKSKGISSRVRSGWDPYAAPFPGKACDHWVTEYFKKDENRWITIDVDSSLENIGFDPYDMPEGKFIYAADAWLGQREGKYAKDYFWNAAPNANPVVTAWELFYDFHCLMNNEVIYLHWPAFAKSFNLDDISENDRKEIDELAKLMQRPDENFDQLKAIWETKEKFRTLKGALL